MWCSQKKMFLIKKKKETPLSAPTLTNWNQEAPGQPSTPQMPPAHAYLVMLGSVTSLPALTAALKQ